MEKFEDFIILDEILENINLEEWDLIFEEDNLKKEVGGLVGGIAATAAATKAIHKN